MKTNLNIKFQGVKGGNIQYLENKGKASIFFDSNSITVDAFEGKGDTYKKRDELLIKIIIDGEFEFIGTSAQLKKMLAQ